MKKLRREQQLRPDLSLGSFIWDIITLTVLEFNLRKGSNFSSVASTRCLRLDSL